MTDRMQNQLEQAYNLIQQERLDEAVALLRPIVQAAPNDPDAWWLLANAVSDPTDAYDALGHVLRLEPNHEDAQELLDNLLEDYPELGATRPASGSASTAKASWDASFGEGADPAFGGGVVNDPRRISSHADAVDDMFSDLNATQADLGFDTDFQTRTASAFDDNYMRSGIARPGTPAASSAFGVEEDEDIFGTEAQTTDEDLFAIGNKGAAPQPVARAQQPTAEDSDLDALFGTAAPKRTNPDAAFDFGTGDPSFLSAVDGEPTMNEQKRSTRTGRKTNTTAARAIPAQDPFAAEAKANRRSPVLPLVAVLLLLGVIAAIVYFAVVRPTQTTPTQVAGGASVTPAVTADAGGVVDVASLLDSTKSQFSAANFANPEATFADQTFAVKTCEKPGRTLRQRIFEAMDLIGQQVAQARKDVSKVSLEFTDCARPTVRLYRASVPIDAVVTYVDGGLTDATTYRAAWTAN